MLEQLISVVSKVGMSALITCANQVPANDVTIGQIESPAGWSYLASDFYPSNLISDVATGGWAKANGQFYFHGKNIVDAQGRDYDQGFALIKNSTLPKNKHIFLSTELRSYCSKIDGQCAVGVVLLESESRYRGLYQMTGNGNLNSDVAALAPCEYIPTAQPTAGANLWQKLAIDYSPDGAWKYYINDVMVASEPAGKIKAEFTSDPHIALYMTASNNSSYTEGAYKNLVAYVGEIERGFMSASSNSATAPNVFNGGMWNSGGMPWAWISQRLPSKKNILKVNLKVAQMPAGRTIHQIYLDGVLAKTVDSYTKDGDIVSVIFNPPVQATSITVQTVLSPSWVAWRGFDVITAEAVQ